MPFCPWARRPDAVPHCQAPGRCSEFIRDAWQSVNRVDDTQYSIAFDWNFRAEFTINQAREWRYAGDFHFSLPNQTFGSGDPPPDQFSGTFTITGEGVNYTSDGMMEEEDWPPVTGSEIAQRVDCPDPSLPSVYSQEEVLEMWGGQ